jgi:hypothetical protein
VNAGPHRIHLRGNAQVTGSYDALAETNARSARLVSDLHGKVRDHPQPVLGTPGADGDLQMWASENVNGRFYVGSKAEPSRIRGEAFSNADAYGDDLQLSYRSRGSRRSYAVWDEFVPPVFHPFWDRR